MRAACVWIGLSALSALSWVPGCGDDQPLEIGVGGTVTGLSGSGLVLRNHGGEELAIGADGPFRFGGTIAPGMAYAVAVAAQPDRPTQRCIADHARGIAGAEDVTGITIECATRAFGIGGSVSGLSGGGLVLRNNGSNDLTIAGDGRFEFPTLVGSGHPFEVTIAHHPIAPTQSCAVSGGSGEVGTGGVTTVTVNCATDRFTIGGTVSGLAGTLVLESNLGEGATVTANGAFAFATPMPSGEQYHVTVRAQPTQPSQTCTITGGSGEGEITDNNIRSVQIECATNQFGVGGMVWGLMGSGLVLENNGTDTVAIEVDGEFAFPARVASGEPYHVTIREQPTRPWQLCTVLCEGGTIGAADAMDVCVACSTLTFPIGGTVTGLPSDTYVVLTNNGGDYLMMTSDGAFMFDTPIPSGTSYYVQLTYTPPGQACSVFNGDGNLGGSPIRDVSVRCWPLEVQFIDTAPAPAGTVSACDAGFGVQVNVRAAQTLTRIELPISVSELTQVRFAIFDAGTGERLFASHSVAIAAGEPMAVSPPLSFAMMPDTVYSIGATVQGCGDLQYDRAPDVQNGTRTTAHSDWFDSFDDPVMSPEPPVSLDLRVRLFGTRP